MSPAHSGAPALPEGGLWGQASLTVRPTKVRIIALLAAIFVGYSVAMCVNSVASRFIAPRFALPVRAPGVDPLSGVGLVVYVADPIFLISVCRMLAAVGLCAWMKCAGTAPSGESPSLTDAHFWRAVLAAFFNAGGYAFYLALVSRGSVATWCALVGLYVCGPVAYGIFFRGEARSARKVAGIGVCIIAGVVLGMSEREAEDASVSGLGDALIFFICICMWMICDSIAAFVGRDLHIFYVAAAGGVGFAGAAFVAALVGFAVTSGAELRNAAGTGGLSMPGALSLLFFAQCCGVGAWFACVQLGKLSEASAFLPVTSLYTVLSSILSAIFFGEAPSRLYYAGLPLAATGIGLIMFSENTSVKGLPVPDEAPCDAEKNAAIVVR